MLRIFPQTAQVKDNRLFIGGCDVNALAAEFGTPLYVFDEATLRGRCREYREGLAAGHPDSLVAYACKAFANRALMQLFSEEGLGLDVVSGGELAIARSADFPMERVFFNGNNKSRQELEMALECSVGRIVVDNLYELALLHEVATNASARQGILLRLSPGVDPHTHAHLTTGVTDSKFGFPMVQAEEALAEAMSCGCIEPVGIHFHIGSQIFELAPFKQAVEIVLDFAAEMGSKCGFALRELSIGGGLGIAYTGDAEAPAIAGFAEAICSTVKLKSESLGLSPPRLIVEPGRSIAGQAGVALYTVGAIKGISGVRKYVSVDGGISDNIRPAFYGARYEALVANRVQAEEHEQVTVAGKLCESGDILIRDIELPKLEAGDILAVPCCGAYSLAMASNYNAALKPAVVMVNDGGARLIRRRESYDDLMRCDTIQGGQ